MDMQGILEEREMVGYLDGGRKLCEGALPQGFSDAVSIPAVQLPINNILSDCMLHRL